MYVCMYVCMYHMYVCMYVVMVPYPSLNLYGYVRMVVCVCMGWGSVNVTK